MKEERIAYIIGLHGLEIDGDQKMFEDVLSTIDSFEHRGKFYLSNFKTCEVSEVGLPTCQIVRYLKANPGAEMEEILAQFCQMYSPDLLSEVIAQLRDYLATIPRTAHTQPGRLKLLIHGPVIDDVSNSAAGAEIVWHTIAERLRASCDIYYLTSRKEDAPEGAIFVNRDDVASLIRVHQQQFDAVLCPIPVYNSRPLLRILRFLNCPLIIRVPNIRGHNGDFINAILLWYAAMRDFDRLVVPSQAVIDFYSNFISDKEIFTCIPNGVDKTLFKPMDKMEAKQQVAKLVADDRILKMPVIGFLSRFQPEKGAGYYLALARQNPDYLFLVVAPTLASYQLRDFPENFIFAGPQKRPILPLFFNAFDVHCFPSVVGEESFGNAPLEAMACGVPVVAARFSGLPEVIGDGGVLVDCDIFDHEIGSFAGYIPIDTLSAAVREVIGDNSKRQRLAQNALKQAQRFDWDKTAEAFLSLIKRQKQRQKITYQKRNRIPQVIFSEYYPISERHRCVRSHLLSLVGIQGENPFMQSAYTQDVVEGLILSLMQNHSTREIEALISHLFPESGLAALKRVKSFVETIG